MTALTSRVLSFVSNSGLRTVGCPTSASTAVPPRAGFGTVATGWHAVSARAAAPAAAKKLRLEMRCHPDVSDGARKESRDEDPRRPVDLALQAAPRAVTAAEPVPAAAADRPAEARCLRCLDQDPGHQEHRDHGLGDDQSVLELGHWTRRVYLRNAARPKSSRTVS